MMMDSELIEKVGQAIRAEMRPERKYAGPLHLDHDVHEYEALASAALAVFEAAQKPTDDEREAMLAEAEKRWPRALFQADPGASEQAAFIRGAEWAFGFRRPVSPEQVEPSDAIREALAVLESHEPGEADQLERIYRAENILRSALSGQEVPGE